MSEAYPKIMEYMGQKIIINEVSWNEARGLRIESILPDKNILKVQGLNVLGYHDSSGNGSYNEEDETGKKVQIVESTLYNIEKREEYEMELEYPGYFIAAPTAFEINMK